jgi:hypothetical protein
MSMKNGIANKNIKLTHGDIMKVQLLLAIAIVTLIPCSANAQYANMDAIFQRNAQINRDVEQWRQELKSQPQSRNTSGRRNYSNPSNTTIISNPSESIRQSVYRSQQQMLDRKRQADAINNGSSTAIKANSVLNGR